MDTIQAKAIFNQVAAKHTANGDLDQAARLDLAVEYFTNSTFRKALQDHLWEQAKHDQH